MAMQITVRGSAERRWPAECGTLDLAVAVKGPDRTEVAAEATEMHARLTAELGELESSGAILSYTADAVQVLAERPWLPEGGRGEVFQSVRLGVRAIFHEAEALSSFVGRWSADSRVEVGGVSWDLTPEHRREYEAVVRADAVRDAVAKAQAYADAVGAGTVRPTRLSDPGMLGPGQPEPRLMKAAFADSAGGGLSLRPGEIIVVGEVDAQFDVD